MGLKLSLDQTLTRDKNLLQHGIMVEYDLEAKVTMYCEFAFQNYPMDNSKCMFRFGGQWSGVRFILYDPGNHFHRRNSYHATDFDIIIDFVEYRSNETNTMIIGFDLALDRSIGSYIVRYYVPTITIVIISQVSFMVPMTAIPGRVVLIVTPFLTLVSIFLQQMVSSTISSRNIFCLINCFKYMHLSLFANILNFSRKALQVQKWINLDFTFLSRYILSLLL